MEFECLATGSTGNCYLVKTGSSNILLDAGIRIQNIIRRINLNQLDFCFISHEHSDHSKALKDLQKRGVNIIYNPTIQQPTKNPKYGQIQATWSIPVAHGKTPCTALIIQNENDMILYATDFNKCEYDLKDFKFTHIIVECNYIEEKIQHILTTATNTEKYQRQINSHMGLEGLQIFLDSLDLTATKKIILVHKSHEDILINAPEMGTTILNKYNISTGVCRTSGGIDWYEKKEVEHE